MIIFDNDKEIDGIYLGNTEVIAVYFGNRVVYENGIPSCYAQGVWQDEFIWTEDTIWKD